MSAQNCLSFCHVLSFIGAIIIIASGIGIWYFGNKVDTEKDAKVNELIEGKNALLEQSNVYLADLRNKDAEIVRLKSSVSNMDPVLSLLEVQPNEAEPSKVALVMGASYPVDLRQIDARIEFGSAVLNARRSVVGSGTVQCNIRDPLVKGNVVKLSGGPLNASNYLVLKVQTEGHIDIRSHNLKVQK